MDETIEPSTKEIVKEEIENDMMKKLKEIFGKGVPEEHAEEEVEPRPPLEEAIERAIYSLGEIAILSEYGRTAQAAEEAREALEVISALKQKYDEQNAIMDALSKPAVSYNTPAPERIWDDGAEMYK